MLLWATPPTAAVGIELQNDLLDGWMNENLSSDLTDSIGRSFRPVTDAWEFDVLYDAVETAEQSSGGRAQDGEISTIAIPRLEGSFQRMLKPDASVTLRFDRPVGKLQVAGQVQFAVSADSTHQVFRLMARDYAQGQTYPVNVIWQATTGEPLPPLHLQVTTPPPLSVAINTEGLANLGLVLPLRLTFSEPLAEREKTLQQVTVRTGDHQDVPGTWRWVGKRSLHFTPRPAWPASSVIEVSVDATSLRTDYYPYLGRLQVGRHRKRLILRETPR
jgi:hypothetical protein